MKKLLTVIYILILVQTVGKAQCPPGALAFQSLYPQCATGCGVLLLGWPEGVLVNIYGGSPLGVITTTIISGTLGGGGTGDAFTCVPCGIPLVYAAASPNATSGCVIATVGTVPVKLTSFSATNINNNTNLIKWTTSQELEPVKYSIQRSQNGTVFTDIITLTGKQLANNQYTFSDESILKASVYYRLKVAEISGPIFYSSITFIKKQTNFGFSVYPNPIEKGFKLTLPQQFLPASFQIINTQGQTIYSSYTQKATTEIDTPLPSGIFAIRVKGKNNEVTTQTIIKK